MILTILIIIILFSGVTKGLRRGFVLQVFSLVSLFGAFIIAWLFNDQLAPMLSNIIPYPESEDNTWSSITALFPLESSYYKTIAFIILFIIARIIIRIIASFFDSVSQLPLLHSVNRLLGAVFGFVEKYIFVFIVLYILLFIPTTQEWVFSSTFAMNIIEKTPYLSEFIQNLTIMRSI